MGFDTEHYALKLAIRPGFVQFDKAYETSQLAGVPRLCSLSAMNGWSSVLRN